MTKALTLVGEVSVDGDFLTTFGVVGASGNKQMFTDVTTVCGADGDVVVAGDTVLVVDLMFSLFSHDSMRRRV